MSVLCDEGLEHGGLIFEFILLTEHMCHATILTFDWTDWGALHMAKLIDIESSLFKNMPHAFQASIWQCHFFGFCHSVLQLDLIQE